MLAPAQISIPNLPNKRDDVMESLSLIKRFNSLQSQEDIVMCPNDKDNDFKSS